MKHPFRHKANSKHGPLRGAKKRTAKRVSAMDVRVPWGWVTVGGR